MITLTIEVKLLTFKYISKEVLVLRKLFQKLTLTLEVV